MARTGAEATLTAPTTAVRTRKSDRFLAELRSCERVVFLSHVQPDPDSLGSMLGLAHLVRQRSGKPCVLTQDGLVSRSENRALVDLIPIELEPLAAFQKRTGDAFVMVDSQPGTGRHTTDRGRSIAAVIDHHVTPGNLNGVQFADIRPDFGATCTIVTRYLTEQGASIPAPLATALYYGIETELSGFPREATPADDEALNLLFPSANKDLLAQIRNAQLPQSHFECLALALQNAVVCDRFLFTWIDPLRQPEQAAEIVDTLVRFDGADWAVCAGVYGDKIIISVRSAKANAGAGELLREVVAGLGNAGGHERRAGGCVMIADRSPTGLANLRTELFNRFQSVFKLRDDKARPLAFFSTEC